MAADLEVLIVGRSYSGLSAALMLGRARRSVLVVGLGGPRNESVFHVHGLITRDGASPADLIAAAERELEKYPTVELVADRAVGLAAADGGWRASFGRGTSTARTVIIATGANDHPPAIPGLAEHWGRGVFTCAYCDGFEHRDAHLAVVGSTTFVPHIARLLTGWSDHVSAFHDGLDPVVRADLVAHGVSVDGRAIVRVHGDGRAVSSLELSDGTAVPIGALFVAALPRPNNQLAVQLGCDVDEHGYVRVDAMKRTTVSDVWAIGDVTSLRSNMAVAIADGVLAAADCNASLIDRRWTEAR